MPVESEVCYTRDLSQPISFHLGKRLKPRPIDFMGLAHIIETTLPRRHHSPLYIILSQTVSEGTDQGDEAAQYLCH